LGLGCLWALTGHRVQREPHYDKSGPEKWFGSSDGKIYKLAVAAFREGFPGIAKRAAKTRLDGVYSGEESIGVSTRLKT
jgi:hypothetical protein